MPLSRPVIVAAPTLAAWLALRIIAAEYGAPSERGADEAAGAADGLAATGGA